MYVKLAGPFVQISPPVKPSEKRNVEKAGFYQIKAYQRKINIKKRANNGMCDVERKISLTIDLVF